MLERRIVMPDPDSASLVRKVCPPAAWLEALLLLHSCVQMLQRQRSSRWSVPHSLAWL